MGAPRAVALATVVLAALALAGPSFGATAVRLSVSAGSEQANGASFSAASSADGRYVAFVSLASNLVVGDTNDGSEVHVGARHSAGSGSARGQAVSAGRSRVSSAETLPGCLLDLVAPEIGRREWAGCDLQTVRRASP